MLQVRRLEKIIENRTALSIEELDINAGDIVTVVGQIGSGKSLLIRLLSGVMVPSGGKALLDGIDVHSSPEARSRIGVLFEEDLLYDRTSALGNLELYCRLHNLPASRAGEVLAVRSEREHRAALILTFGGGTNEIQRDIIAAAGLGLPYRR